MAGMMSASRWMPWAALALMLAGPAPAWAGWFERDNAIAYDLSRQGQNRQALKYWNHSAKGLYGRGTALMHLGRMQEAEQAFRQALALAPHKTGFSDQLTMPVKRRPHFMASVWYNLGNALYAQNELTGARDAWLKALNFEPGHAKARKNLAIVDHLLGARERQASPTPAGPGQSKKTKSDKSDSKAASSTPHAAAPLHLPGHSHQQVQVSGEPGKRKRHAASRHAGAGKTGRHSARHAESMPQSGGGGTGAAGQQSGTSPGRGSGMSRQQAIQQLRMVKEGVSVFLRHRLSEKGRGSDADGGKPW